MEGTHMPTEMEIYKIHQKSLVKEAINSDLPPSLTVFLYRNTPEDKIDQIVRDLQRYGQTDGPFLDIGDYSIGVTLKDKGAGKALLAYCDRSPNIEYIAADAATVPESTSFRYRTLDKYLP